jgi:hypothetical protein
VMVNGTFIGVVAARRAAFSLVGLPNQRGILVGLLPT